MPPRAPFRPVLVGLTLAAGLLSGCAAHPGGDEAVPTFRSGSSAAAPGPGPAAPPGLALPVDCARVLDAPAMSALLGLPVAGVDLRTVLGQAAPSVGRRERVSCVYRRSTNRGAEPELLMVLAAYDTPAAAGAQLRTNVAAERGSAGSAEELTLGAAPAVLFDEGADTVLMVTNGRTSVTLTLRDGVVPAGQVRPILLDLAQRVLPALAPGPPGTPR